MVRIKNRYAVVEINVEGRPADAPLELRPFALYESVLGAVRRLHGEYGVALVKSGFVTKYCNRATRIALMRARHGHPHLLLLDSLKRVDKIDDKLVRLKTIHVGATMRQCFKFIRRHQTDRLNRMWTKLGTDEQRKRFRDALMDFESADQNNIIMK